MPRWFDFLEYYEEMTLRSVGALGLYEYILAMLARYHSIQRHNYVWLVDVIHIHMTPGTYVYIASVACLPKLREALILPQLTIIL